MEIALLLISIILLLFGIAGSLLPVLPGPPLSWLGFLCFHFTEYGAFSWGVHAAMFGAMALMVALDYVIPIWGTKKFGGTRAGMWGSGIGLLAGLFFGPVGIIAGPFIGAFLFELAADASDVNRAFKSALGSLLGFFLGTGLKLAYGIFAATLCAWQFF